MFCIIYTLIWVITTLSAHSVVFLVFLKVRRLELPNVVFLVLSFNSSLEDVELPNYLDCHNEDSLQNPWRQGVRVRKERVRDDYPKCQLWLSKQPTDRGPQVVKDNYSPLISTDVRNLCKNRHFQVVTLTLPVGFRRL